MPHKADLLASGLGFPEGPVVMGDGRIVLCDGNTGELLAHQGGVWWAEFYNDMAHLELPR